MLRHRTSVVFGASGFLTICAALFLTSTECWGQPAPSESDAERLLRQLAQPSGQQLPLSVQRTLLEVHYRNQVNRHGRVLDKLRVDQGVSKLEDVRHEIGLSEAYYDLARANVEVTRFRNQVGKYALGIAEVIPIKNPVASVGVKVLSKLSDPMMAGTEAITNWTVDFGVSKAFTPDTTEQRVRDFARTAVLDDQGNVDQAKLKDATSFFQKTFVENPAFRDLDDKQKAELTRAMQARLEQAIDDQGETISDIANRMHFVQGDARTAVDLMRKTKSLIDESAKRQQDFAEKVAANQLIINGSLQNLANKIEANNDLAKINNKIASSNGFKLDVIMSAMYDQLPTERKLEWVKSDYVLLPPDVKNDEVARLEQRSIVEHQLAMSNDVQNYLQQGREVLEIAKHLGLPEGALDVAGKAVAVSEVANGALKNFVSGNYIGAVASVFSLLGGGGPDMAEIRHRQIMGEFGIVNKRLDALLDGEQKILEVVADIDQKVVQLGQIIVAQHEEVMRQLAVIQGQVAWNTELLDQLLRRDLDSCKNFLAIRRRSDYSEMESFFDHHLEGFNAGEAMISSWTGGIDPTKGEGWADLNRWYFERTHLRQNENDKLIAALEAHLLSTHTVLKTLYTDDASRKRAWSALALPAKRIDELQIKIENVKAQTLSPIPMPYEVIHRLLSPAAVSEFSQTSSSFSDFYFLVNRAAQPVRLFMPSELDAVGTFSSDDMNARRDKAENVLRFCLAVTNAVVAQQALLGGDMLLPKLADTVESESTRGMLKANQIMARNTLMYALRQRMGANGYSVLAYSFALESNDASYLEQITKQEGVLKWSFATKQIKESDGDGKDVDVRGWFVTIGDVELPMPSAEHVRDGTLEVMPGVTTLASVREELIEKITELEFTKSLPADHALKFGLLYLSTLETRAR
jgi:hypothetical protein